ncbi:AGCS family alanine or glycine:cation symporter [Pontibacter ummariensis]|uniref:Alanine or glycine:cation symporter, AGCS family n=1 Tax=Pontibacter ummariensis TaxID=1610492 RepID=A0A239B4K3_9BACT|nr:alanine/glycine:cation symporter family protein [Pontibacter ummariensis]PRY16307.1 AGCS family alanine or glycine:cation symporter [Pontibacter ummariensis]SNS02886.1 alanine or glycine:cation symporter, AGCS family [Pontibacter ummariensis]
MKRILVSTFLFIAPLTNLLAQAPEPSIDEKIDAAVAPTAQYISDIIFFEIGFGGYAIPLILIWLLAGAIFFTFYLGFINFRGFKHALDLVRGKYDQEDAPGEVSHFQALTAAVSGTVGLGNIAGVAIAISLGGPGATFWMIVAGLLGMSSKFVSCTLGVKYRDVHPDGTVSGGPMHYLNKGLRERGMGKAGKFLAAFFAIMCIGGSLGAGNMFQINQATHQFIAVTGGEESFFGGGNSWMFGLIISVLVGLVILGGMKSIAQVTEKVVPLMCGVYILAAIIVLAVNFTQIPEAFMLILDGAFSGSAIAGGIVGTMIQGLRRGLFSNEAGIGSASIAHSAVKTNVPVTEGFVASLEPFIDTVVVCTMTALVIVVTGAYNVESVDGIALTSASFATVISWFPVVLAVAVILFAFSTMITWSYYGLKSWTYLFGNTKAADISFKVIFCAFIVLGAPMKLNSVVAFSDAMLFAMSIPNMVGLYILSPVVKQEMQAFLTYARSSRKQPLSEDAVEAAQA